jgi:hypothetical protein
MDEIPPAVVHQRAGDVTVMTIALLQALKVGAE